MKPETSALWVTFALTMLRYAFAAAGMATFATEHDSELVNAAGLLVSLGAFGIGAWKNHRDKKVNTALKAEVVAARSDTAVAQFEASNAKEETRLLRRNTAQIFTPITPNSNITQ